MPAILGQPLPGSLSRWKASGMGIFTRDLPDWVRQVRTSAHACTMCGAMVALDLLDRHKAWHQEVDTAWSSS